MTCTVPFHAGAISTTSIVQVPGPVATPFSHRWARWFRFITLGLWIIGNLSLARGGSTVVFGPEKCVRATGAPKTEVRTFAAPASLPATYTLRIDNDTVSSAVVTLNGKEIAGPSDFSQQVTVITRSVALLATNTLE